MNVCHVCEGDKQTTTVRTKSGYPPTVELCDECIAVGTKNWEKRTGMRVLTADMWSGIKRELEER